MSEKPWRTWPEEQPPTKRLQAMRKAYEAYVTNALCWLTPEGWERVLAAFLLPELEDACSPDEHDVMAMMARGYWCAVGLP